MKEFKIEEVFARPLKLERGEEAFLLMRSKGNKFIHIAGWVTGEVDMSTPLLERQMVIDHNGKKSCYFTGSLFTVVSEKTLHA